MHLIGVSRAGKERVGFARYRKGVGWILSAVTAVDAMDVIRLSYEPETTRIVVHISSSGKYFVEQLRGAGYEVEVAAGACRRGDRQIASTVWGEDRRLSELALSAFELVRHRVGGNPGRAGA